MAKIVDPDALNQGTEIIFDKAAKTIQLLIAGNLNDDSPGSTSGVTLQAVYSFCKEEWKDDIDLNKLRFPFDAITAGKMDLVNTWDWADDQSRDLVRDGGWSLRSGAGVSQEEYMSIISLGGTFAATSDQAYYQGDVGFDQTVDDFDKTDEINEPVKIYGDATHGNFDNRDFFKIFLREQAKLYAQGNLIVDQGLASLDYAIYKLPLINATDIKVAATDLEIDTTEPYVGASDLSITDGVTTDASPTFTSATGGFEAGDVGKLITIAAGLNPGRYEIVSYATPNSVDVDRNFVAETNIVANRRPKGMTIDYLKGNDFITWVSAGSYSIDDVVLDASLSPAQWFRAITNHSGVTTAPNLDAVNWEAYPGEKQIGADYYAFNRKVDGNGGTLVEVYEFLQRQLRQDGLSGVIDINDDISGETYGTINGNIAVSLSNFLGDTLRSDPGTLIDNYQLNGIQMFDITVDGGGLDSEGIPITSTLREYPFISAGTIVFNPTLVDDADAEFTMYFTTNPAGDFDTVNAVIVQNADDVDIKAETITGDVDFTFDYDNNVQGGRTAGTDAAVTIIAIGLSGAQWIAAAFTITKVTGLSFPVNAALERNYSNP